MNDDISKYQLSLYNPSRFVQEEFRAQYEEKKIRNFSQADRERFLIGMMRVNFLKRLESSVFSFAIAMNRTVEKIENLENCLRKFKEHQSQVAEDLQPDFFEESDEEDEDLTLAFQVGGKLKFQMAHLRIDDWLQALAKDKQQLSRLANDALAANPRRDAKLAELRKIIEQKTRHPTVNNDGEENRKIIVFCAFADTAAYLYEQLEAWAREKLNVHIALVSGGARPNRTTFGHRNSPIS